MNNRNFMEMAGEQWADKKFVCVGLDSDQEKIPNLKGIFKEDVLIYVLLFNTAIIEATRDIAGFYKPNVAFYESMGDLGAEVLKNTITHIHDQAPHVPVILDAKRGDIGKTNDHYVKAAFDYFKADAVTIHPYLGKTGMLPFLN